LLNPSADITVKWLPAEPFPGPNTPPKKEKQEKKRDDGLLDDQFIYRQFFITSKKVAHKI
jgi:hypothetical protein